MTHLSGCPFKIWFSIFVVEDARIFGVDRVIKMGSSPWASLAHCKLEVDRAQFFKKIGIDNFLVRST